MSIEQTKPSQEVDNNEDGTRLIASMQRLLGLYERNCDDMGDNSRDLVQGSKEGLHNRYRELQQLFGDEEARNMLAAVFSSKQLTLLQEVIATPE